MRPFCRILLLVVVLGILTAPLIDARGKGKKRKHKANRNKRQEELNVQPANEEPVQPLNESPVQPANEEPVPPEEVFFLQKQYLKHLILSSNFCQKNLN